MKPRLLVVELHHLGDAVLSIPFVRAAQISHEVHVLCRPATRAVFELLKSPPAVHAWEPPWVDSTQCTARQSLVAARAHGRTLRPLEFQAAACVWADVRAGILMAETRALKCIGFPMTRGNYYASELPWRRRRRILGRLLEMAWNLTAPRHPLLTLPLYRESTLQPHLRCWEQIADALGIACDYSLPWIPSACVHIPRSDGRILLAYHPHARLPGKQWPVGRWKELLASEFVDKHFELLEIVPPGCRPIGPDTARRANTADIAALVEAIASADALLCHDSLPAHLAAALGRPVVTIFGSGEPDWFAPWKNHDLAVCRRFCPLHPCIDRCGMDRYICMDSVSVRDVSAKLEKILHTK